MSEQTQMVEQRCHPGKLMRVAVVALVGLLLLGMAISGIQQAAWSEGYALGLMAGNGGGDTLSQYLLYNSGNLGRSGPGFGTFLFIGLLIFGFFALARMGRMWMWRTYGGPDAEEWRRRWQGERGMQSAERGTDDVTEKGDKNGG